MPEFLNIMVVEDDEILRMDVHGRLEKLGHQIVASAESGAQAIQYYQANDSQVDLVLMDIMLGGTLDGIDTARQLVTHRPVPVIFLTAFADTSTIERAKLPFTAGYLLKPCSDQDLRIAIELGLYHFRQRLKDSEGKRSGQEMGPVRDREKKMIAVWAGEDMFLLDKHEICFVEVQTGVINICTQTASYTVRGTLKEWEDKLADAPFFRCHKSFLVNMEKIVRLTPCLDNSYLISLSCHKKTIPLSRQRAVAFKQILA